MRLSRTCYDKSHRCPGWAGGGMHYAKTDRCIDGRVEVRPGKIATFVEPDETYVYNTTHPSESPWRFGQCNTCDVVTWPVVTRWLDPAWTLWKIKWQLRRWRNR